MQNTNKAPRAGIVDMLQVKHPRTNSAKWKLLIHSDAYNDDLPYWVNE